MRRGEVARVRPLLSSLVAVLFAACGPELEPTAALKQALPSSTVVISQYYGSGGTTGQPMQPPFRTDFIELHNVSAQPVALGSLTLQYAAFMGSNWIVSDFDPAATIPAGGFHLVAFRAGQTTIGAALPAPDTVNVTLDLGRAEFKLAIVDGVTPLTGTCPRTGPDATRIIDFLGAGTANCFEGTAAPAASIVTGLLRKGDGCLDTDDNAADFIATTPSPRNAATGPVLCFGDGGSTGIPDAGQPAVDAGAADAGVRPVDAGAPVDAGVVTVDAGSPDAGRVTVDAGSPLDAGSHSDAGAADGGTTPTLTARSGCKCSSVDASTFVFALALVAFGRRRTPR